MDGGRWRVDREREADYSAYSVHRIYRAGGEWRTMGREKEGTTV